MGHFLTTMKLAAIGQSVTWLPSLDAVGNTSTFAHKVETAFQIAGFSIGMAALAGCFAVLMLAGDRLRDRIKSHMTWIVLSIIGLFAVGAIATLAKTYSQSSFR